MTNQDDELAIGMVLDPDANLYVTGWTDSATPGGQEVFVAKYDSTGQLQWRTQAGGATPDRDGGRGVGLDGDGNVYVTGEFNGAETFWGVRLNATQNTEFFLAKLDNGGNVQWVAQSEGGRAFGVYGTGLAVDAAGNSYAVGFADNGAAITFRSANTEFPTVTVPNPNNTGYSAFLVKYDTNGHVLCAQLMGGPESTYATKVAVDGDGFVFVSASFRNWTVVDGMRIDAAGQRDFLVAKFEDDCEGTVWPKAWNPVPHPDEGGDALGSGGIAVDATGHVYVAGAFEGWIDFGGGVPRLASPGGHDGFGVQYDNGGVPQWASQAGGGDLDLFFDVVLDGQGSMYAAGIVGRNVAACNRGGAAVVKYDRSGALQWGYLARSEPAALGGSPLDEVGSAALKCAVDGFGNCYLAGWYRTDTWFGTTRLVPQAYWNLFLAKLAAPTGATPTPECFVRADVDQDGSIALTDGMRVLLHLFNSGNLPQPIACLDAADSNDDGQLNLTDGVFIFRWLFRGGSARPPPSPSDTDYPADDCEPDPTVDPLDCATSPTACS